RAQQVDGDAILLPLFPTRGSGPCDAPSYSAVLGDKPRTLVRTRASLRARRPTHVAQRGGGDDVRVVRKPLRNVAEQATRLRIVLFCEQAEIGGQPFSVRENVDGFGPASLMSQSFAQPERACEEGAFSPLDHRGSGSRSHRRRLSAR